MKDMAVIGLTIGVLGALLLTFVMPWLWSAVGLV